jgi:hypothetical protein
MDCPMVRYRAATHQRQRTSLYLRRMVRLEQLNRVILVRGGPAFDQQIVPPLGGSALCHDRENAALTD